MKKMSKAEVFMKESQEDDGRSITVVKKIIGVKSNDSDVFCQNCLLDYYTVHLRKDQYQIVFMNMLNLILTQHPS